VIDKQIIKITRDECKSSGVSFYRGKGSYLRYGGGVRVNGFFESGDNPKLFDIDIEETYSRLKNLYSACVKI